MKDVHAIQFSYDWLELLLGCDDEQSAH